MPKRSQDAIGSTFRAHSILSALAGWDARDGSDRIEVAVGRDLQFIRINRTVVGALAGVLIHTVAVVLG